jgi:type I restriction enzyme S subunit
MGSEWKETTVGDFMPFIYGEGLPENQRIPGPYPVYGSGGVVGSHEKPLSEGGTIVIGRKGSVGTVYYCPSPCWPIDTTFYITENDPEILRFKYYLLKSIGLSGMNSDSAVPGLNRNAAHSRKIKIPSLTEQRRIAGILGAFDDKIELNRRMNATLEAMARALFQSWFVDFDPVRAKMDGRWRQGESLPGLPAAWWHLFPDRLVDSELGPIPKGWMILSLDELALFRNGLALQKFPAEPGKDALPVIKIAQMRTGDTRGCDWANANIGKDYIVEDGDILFSWSGSLECMIWAGGRGALNQHLFKVTSKQFPKWLYYFYILENLERFREIAAGKATTMGHIQRYHLTDTRLVLPSASMLKAASEIFTPVIETLWKRNVENRTLATLRDSMLGSLLRD